MIKDLKTRSSAIFIGFPSLPVIFNDMSIILYNIQTVSVIAGFYVVLTTKSNSDRKTVKTFF